MLLCIDAWYAALSLPPYRSTSSNASVLQTKNPEKYAKNTDRNRIRALDSERNKIRAAAVHQAERLAAKHDPTGKTFNVGEVVVLEDGSVQSKEALAIIEERKALKEAERAAKQAGVNSARPAQIQASAEEKSAKGSISKKQLKRQTELQSRPTPPRPVLPEGISLAEGEENFIALWDITDEEIHKRMSNEKRKRSTERKALRRKQKDEKRLNQAMKLLKRQTENRGEKWDKVEGRKIVLKQLEDEDPEEDSQDSGWDDDTDNEDVIAEEPAHAAQAEKTSKKLKKLKEDSGPSSNNDVGQASVSEARPKEKKSKRRAEDDLVEEPKTKKSKKSKNSTAKHAEELKAPTTTEPEFQTESATTEKKRKSKNKIHSSELAPDAGPERKVEAKKIPKEKKRAKTEKQRQETETVEAAIAPSTRQKFSTKRKHEKEREEAEAPAEREKLHKKKVKSDETPPTGSGPAEQWNPDALTGDAARKQKFLRLLGAGKTNAAATDGAKHKSSAKVEDITKVQSELERQYEAGMKMKHDGGAKRRGLGA